MIGRMCWSTNMLFEELHRSNHSNCIVPWDSHGSLASKRAILIGEINRAVSRSTDDNNRKESLSKLTQVFARNGYPKSFVRASVHRVLHNQPRINDQEDWIYMKLPYINEEFKRRSLAVVHRSGLNNIKIHFLNGKSSSQRFAPRKEQRIALIIARPANRGKNQIVATIKTLYTKLNAGIVIKFILVKLVGQLARALKNI